MPSSSLKRTATTHNAVKNMPNTNGNSTQPCRNPPRVTSNHSECSSSSVRTHASMRSWNWRIPASLLPGTSKRASTSHGSSPSTELCVLFLLVDEAHVPEEVPLSSEFLQSAHDEQHMESPLNAPEGSGTAPRGGPPFVRWSCFGGIQRLSTISCPHGQRVKFHSNCCCNRSDSFYYQRALMVASLLAGGGRTPSRKTLTRIL